MTTAEYTKLGKKWLQAAEDAAWDHVNKRGSYFEDGPNYGIMATLIASLVQGFATLEASRQRDEA